LYIIRRAGPEELKLLRAIADYQFKAPVGNILVPDDVNLKISKNTGRLREIISSDGRRVASIRASTFTYNLTLYGASLLHKATKPPKLRVVAVSEVSNEIIRTSSLFSRHVLTVDDDLRAGDEVLVVNEGDELLCVGRLVLSPDEVMYFTRGVAVRLRECREV